MIWRLPFCLFNRHRPSPPSVRWNGANYLGQCRDCRQPIRKSGRGFWKRQAEQTGA